jgi:hypothetical protein
MAITRTDSLQSWNDIIEWMQANLVPNFLLMVQVDPEDSTLINCYGLGGQKLFGITMTSGTTMKPIHIYHSDGTETEITWSGNSPSFRWAAVCKNGAIMRFSNSSSSNTTSSNTSLIVIFTKNNLGRSTVITTKPTSNSAQSQMYTNVYVEAEGDNPTDAPLTFGMRLMEQTQLIPFATNPVSNVVSYTPDAYYVQCGNFYDIGYTTFVDANNVTYLTTGCWAVKDE